MNNHDAIDNAMSLILDGHYDTALGVLWRMKRESEPMSMDEVNASIRDSIRRIANSPAEPTLAQRALADRDAHEAKLARDRERKKREREMLREMKGGSITKLPPMKRIRPLKVREVPCPKCGAKAGQPCTGYTSAGKFGKPTGKPIKTYHTARTNKVKWSNAPILKPIDVAVVVPLDEV